MTPRKALKAKLDELTKGEEERRLSRRIVIFLADDFGVSSEAMVRRLEEVQLAPSGAWDWFASKGGITRKDVMQVLGRPLQDDNAREQSASPFSPKVGLMAYRVWKREMMTESQLADLLKVDRTTLRTFLYDLQSEESEADDLFKLPQ